MRSLLVISLMLVLGACTRMSADFHLDNAYRQYAAGDCAAVALELSQAQRQIRSRPYLQPEISLLRGQCLERGRPRAHAPRRATACGSPPSAAEPRSGQAGASAAMRLRVGCGWR